ncbi:serine hydrolase [Mesorhizobium sp. M1A.F.Ca.ET.072.01.1.1]|uniref:serine hydrolase domain-containing protein n=1 Tax=Mesorhizobium sp. M1A.F.Ca.ET.072.01.1.1 TaxID=2496753 RepID=UPI001677B4D6|nr:serine hydrolase [Mesorhizobium sp. M1A.F.Ca.ET.072.01.1.1]
MDKQAKKHFVPGAMVSLCVLVTCFYPWPAHAAEPDQPAWPTNEWRMSTPEEQGMDSSALAGLVGYGSSHNFDSLLVVRHGRIVAEAYYAPYTAGIPHEIYSSTKAVTGTLLGMVYKDGLLDRLDHPILDFFADRQVANVDDRKKAITVQNLLDMTSGLDWDQGFEGGRQQSMKDLYRSSNWTQFILDRPMAHPPGEVFNYSNGNADLVSAIITRLTGKLAEDYAREKLFDPLGIVDWHWDRDPQGLTKGEGMLYLLPRDMAKLGYLYLHHGEWEGRQLLPPGWADVLNHTLVNVHATGDANESYSNFIWVFPDRHVYRMDGKNGQLIVVFPDLDVVVVTTARKQVRYKALIDAVSGAVKSQSALPPDPDGAKQLASAIQDAATQKPTPVGPVSEIASSISGKIYKFHDDEVGLKSFTLDLADPHPHFDVEISLPDPVGSSVRYSQPIGLDGFYRRGAVKLSDPGIGQITEAKGRWLNGQTFVIDVPVLGSGEQQELILTFSGKKLNFRRRVAVGEGEDVSVDGVQVSN